MDVVYVASPHALHLEHARLALEAGKHVLCEKPLAMTVAEAEQMIGLARQHDRFLMEAMWTACHPVIRAVVDGLAAGGSEPPGRCTPTSGSWCRSVPRATGSSTRRWAPAALLDMGIYPLTVADLDARAGRGAAGDRRPSDPRATTSTSRSSAATPAARLGTSPRR